MFSPPSPELAAYQQLKFALIYLFTGALLTMSGSAFLLFLTHMHQRKQWVLDNKKTEWRELISTLCRSARTILHNHPHSLGPVTGEQARLADAADREARMVIQDRLSIADVMQKENVLEIWERGIAKDEASIFWADWWDLHETLLKAAHKDLGFKK